MKHFIYLGTTLTNQNSIHEEKCRLKSGNVCYHSVQNLSCSGLLYKIIKVKIYRIIILPFVFYGWKTWSLTSREERRPRVFENGVLWRMSGPKKDETTEKWRKLNNEELNDLHSSPNIILVIKSRRIRWVGNVARMGDRKGHTRF